MSQSDTIYTRGFLSQEIETYRKQYRAEYAGDFGACEKTADAVTARLFDADISKIANDENLHIILGLGFWCRCVRACQGAIVLLERGMVPEGQILIRSAYEFLFYGAALLLDETVVDRLLTTDFSERKKQASDMLKYCPQYGAPRTRAMLQEVIDTAPKGKTISVFDAAQIAGYLELYATVYRGMSLVASHATISGTDSVFEAKDAERNTLVFGPGDQNIQFAIGLVKRCLEIGAERFHPHLIPREGTVSAEAA